MSQLLHLMDRPIAFQRSFVRLGAGITGALLLSQLVYWQNRMEGLWFYKTQSDLEDETGLSRYEQESARKKLVAVGVLEEQKKGIPAKLYFRVNEPALAAILLPEIPQACMGKTSKQGCGIPAYSDVENQQAGMGKTSKPVCGNSASIHTVDYTETTQETNTENKTFGVSADAAMPENVNKSDYPPEFEAVWQAYPKRHGGNSKQAAFKAWNARVKQGTKPETILEGVKRYSKFMQADGKVGTAFVKQASTFFGPDHHFDEAWVVPGAKQDHEASLWCTPSTDGSAEIFINPAALARAHNGGYRS